MCQFWQYEKEKNLQNPVNLGIFPMKNPLCRLKSYFPGQKLEKVFPQNKIFYGAFFQKIEFVTKYSVSRKLCPGFVIFHQQERPENFKETKGLKGRW
jgi:hypothetical protein